MEKQTIRINFKSNKGDSSSALIEKDTIKFGGIKISLGALEGLISQMEPQGYANAINNILYSYIQLVAEASSRGAGIEFGGMIPRADDFYYAKIIVESFSEMEVK